MKRETLEQNQTDDLRTVSTLLPVELAERLTDRARAEDRSVAATLRKLIRQYLDGNDMQTEDTEP